MKYALSYAALAAAMLCAPGLAWADDSEIVVTAQRLGGQARDQIGGSVSVLEAEDLQARQVRIVSDVLRDIPGVAVSRSGPAGTLTDVRVRGSEANHVLVLIDGIEASDPFNQSFDFASLIADDVARIEVLRGQQSALYGSDAIGGVIHYITATGAEAPGARARWEAGSFGTVQMTARVAGVASGLDFALSGNVFNTDGTPGAPGGARDLGAENITLAGKFSYEVTDNFRLSASLRHREVTADYNTDTDANGVTLDTPNTYYEGEALYALARAELDLMDGRWRNALVIQGVQEHRFDNQPSFFSTIDADGERLKASYDTSFRFGGAGFVHRVSGGADYEREQFETLSISEQSIENVGLVFGYDVLIGERLALGASLRHDQNDLFDDADTYRVQASYAFETGTRLRAAAGSGVKNPNMVELFGYGFGYVGNPDLKPEKSEGWEIGVEQRLLDGALLLGATYFDNELEDEIVSVGFAPASADNLDRISEQKGVELFAQARLGEQWRIDASYTYLDAEQGGVTEIRRAENIASLNVSWRTAGDRGGLNLNVRYNGEQEDTQFLFVPPFVNPVTLDAYTLVNIGADWRLTEALDVYARVENALDEAYQEVFGYATAGSAAYIGVRAGF